MKVRNNLVSNSSSSSFILGFKEEISKENLAEVFKNDNPFLSEVIEGIVEVIIDNSKESSIEGILEDYCEKTIDKLPTWQQTALNKAKEKGFKIYTGFFEDGGYGVSGLEAFLCHTKIDYQDEKMLFYKEGGY